MIARFDSPRSRTAVLLSALLVAALVLDLWQYTAQRAGRSSSFDNAVSTISYPLERGLLQTKSGIEQAWAWVARGHYLAGENERLAAQVAALESRLVALEEGRAESERQEALLSAYPENAGRKCLAHVIAVGSGGWLSYLLVDRGSADGVEQKDVAVTREGVVGQVYAVTAHTARIVPLSDPSSGVAVLVRRSRETGILKGLGNWRCELRYLHPDAPVRPGDQVITAGTGGIFPKGLRVGTVTSVTADPNTPGKLAEIDPAAEFRKVEEVLLLRSVQ
jgi:rod shape-determining protein MreC